MSSGRKSSKGLTSLSPPILLLGSLLGGSLLRRLGWCSLLRWGLWGGFSGLLGSGHALAPPCCASFKINQRNSLGCDDQGPSNWLQIQQAKVEPAKFTSASESVNRSIQPGRIRSTNPRRVPSLGSVTKPSSHSLATLDLHNSIGPICRLFRQGDLDNFSGFFGICLAVDNNNAEEQAERNEKSATPIEQRAVLQLQDHGFMGDVYRLKDARSFDFYLCNFAE